MFSLRNALKGGSVAKAVYVFVILMIVTSGIAMILKFGYEPAPVKVMSPSFFDDAEQIGKALLRRFYSPVAQDKIVVFGLPPQPEFHRKVVLGFLAAAEAENVPFEVLVSEEQMPPLDISMFKGLEVVRIAMNGREGKDFIDLIRNLKSAGKRVFVYTASVFSSHLVADTPLDRYEKQTGEHLVTITSGPLALRSDQENMIDPPCVGSERDREGVAALGCAFLKSGRGFYRKHLSQEKFVAMMNSPKPADYLLMISYPGQAARLK